MKFDDHDKNKSYTIASLVEQWKKRRLLENPDYQRAESWTLAQKQALVDSIFRNYPIPPLFLHKITDTDLDGNESTNYDIVDGQQRICALAGYLQGEFPLLEPNDRKLKLPKSLRTTVQAPWAGKYFADLEGHEREFLKNREINVFIITEVAHEDEIRDLFIRLQSGTTLSRQQIRDAWPGSIGPYVVKLAGKITRKRHVHPSQKIFQLVDKSGSRPDDDDRDRYVQDRQFCAQLLCLFLARENDPCSCQSVGANDLDRLYHENTDFDTEGFAANRFEEVLAHTTQIIEMAVSAAKTRKGRKKRTKLSVMAAFLLVQDLSKNKFRKIERSFYKTVAQHLLAGHEIVRTGKSTSGVAIESYYNAWRAPILPHIGIELDPQRAFNEAQKEEMFARDGGICQVCKKPVEIGDDDYDHFPIRHELGGRTVPENGRLVHRSGSCHQRGRLARDDEDDGAEDSPAIVLLKQLKKLLPEDRSFDRTLKELSELPIEQQQEVLRELKKNN